MPRLVLTLAAVVLTALTAGAIDVVPPEKTLAERIGHFGVVLRVRALTNPGVRGEDIGPRLRAAMDFVPPNMAGPMFTPVIEQDVEVLEVLKGVSSVPVGRRVTISTSGGHNGMRVTSDWQNRALARGGTYILFGSFDDKRFVYSFWDLFRLEPPSVTTTSSETEYAKELVGRSPAAALSVIRQAISAGPPVVPPRAVRRVDAVTLQRTGRTRGDWRVSGSESFENISTRTLLGLVYEIEPARVLNLPAWADSERYNITARPRSPQPVDVFEPPRFMEGWAELLEERFKLRARRTVSDLPVYILERVVPDALGPNLQKSATDCFVRPNRPSGCSSYSAPGLIRKIGIDWGFLPTALGITDRPVIDRTDLRGPVDLTLQWPASPGGSPDMNAIGNALESQLGLRLRESTSPFPVLLVDHIEQPSEN